MGPGAAGVELDLGVEVVEEGGCELDWGEGAGVVELD